MGSSKKKIKKPKTKSLRGAWIALGKKATIGQVENIQPRLHWAGLPNQESDPLMLAGMEVRLSWRDVEAPVHEEVVVSQITLEEHVGSFTDPKSPCVRWHDYKVQIIQSTDLGSHYQKLLARQRSRGITPEAKEPVTIQEYRARVIVGPPTKETQRLFRQLFDIILPNSTLNGIIFQPVDVAIDEDGNFPIGKTTQRELRKRDTGDLASNMSDLVIDRIFELQGMIAEWLLDKEENKAKRLRRSTEAKAKFEVALENEREFREQIELTSTAITNQRIRISSLEMGVSKLETPDSIEEDSFAGLQQRILETKSLLIIAEKDLNQANENVASTLRKWGTGKQLDSASSVRIEKQDALKSLQQTLSDLEQALAECREQHAQLLKAKASALQEDLKLAEERLRLLEEQLETQRKSLETAQLAKLIARNAVDELT